MSNMSSDYTGTDENSSEGSDEGNLSDEQLNRKFLDLIESCDEDGVTDLLEKSVDIDLNHKNYKGMTGLHVAIEAGCDRIVDLLLSKPDVEIGDALMYAIRDNRYATFVKILDILQAREPENVRSGYKDSAEFPQHVTPLMLAAQCGHYKIIKLLLERDHVIEKPHKPTCSCKEMKHAYWVENWVTLDVYFTLYYAFRVIFVHTGPCISLVVLNLLLFRAMRDAQLKRDKLFKENRKNECKRLRDSNCTTLMLIVVVTVFLMTEIPLAVVTVLHIISSSIKEILDYSVANLLVLFTNFFIIVSYPINFAIYCGMSRQFRETFKELFIRGSVQINRKHGAGGSSRYSLVNGPRTCTNESLL